MTQPKDIEGLRKVADGATPGPWRLETHARGIPTVLGTRKTICSFPGASMAPSRAVNEANATFVATFNPERVSALLSELEAVKGENRRLREACGFGAARFRHYADLHAAKGTPDGDAKAQANIGAAETLEAALVSLKGGGGSSCANLDGSPSGATDGLCKSEGEP